MKMYQILENPSEVKTLRIKYQQNVHFDIAKLCLIFQLKITLLKTKLKINNFIHVFIYICCQASQLSNYPGFSNLNFLFLKN